MKIAKLMYIDGGLQVMLVAADTFRAAAADQLQGWADRSGASMERPNSSKQRPDGVISMALDKANYPKL